MVDKEKMAGGVFGLNFTSLMWCAGFLLMSLMASHWVSVDSDLVLHILYGRHLLEEGLLSTDPLLSGVTDPPILQEWLFEVLVASLDSALGLVAPLLVFAVLMGSLMAGLFRRMRNQGVCLWVALLYAIFVLFTLRIHLIIRPHMVSWAAVYFLAVLLEDWHSGNRSFRRTLVIGAVLMLFWTNMHGGFLLGLALTTVYAVEGGYEAVTRKESEKLVQATTMLLTFALVSLVNPWGWYLHVHLIAFLSNDFLMSTTSDFLAPVWTNGTLPVLTLAALASLIPMLKRWRQVSPRDWLLFIGLLYAAATSARNIPFFGVIVLPGAALYLQQWLSESNKTAARVVLESSGRLEEDEGSNSGVGWPLLVGVTMSLLFLTGTIRVGLYSTNVPVDALDWVNAQTELHGESIFSDYLFAGYLLYATPVERVYLHALNASYPDSRVRNYLQAARGEEGWEEVMENIDWAFVRAEGGHASTFSESTCWQRVYSDDQAMIFQRTWLMSE
jgi:hypothetical protein